MKNKKIVLFIILAICLIGLIPLALEYLIFRNNVYSVLNNEEWSGFLGNYIGSILGGIITLFALYITTKETRKIQTENLLQIKEERTLDAKKERTQYANKIAQEIAKYITHINKYFYLNRRSARLDKEKQNLHNNLQKTQDNFQIKKLQSQIEQKEKEIAAIPADRIIANESFFLLKILFGNIEKEKNIIENVKNITEHLEYIHQNSSNEKTDPNFIKIETEKLLDETVQLINKYVNTEKEK